MNKESSEYWLLNPEIIYLNHGSFGACPLPVLQKQNHWREKMEKEPMNFFVREFETLIDGVRQELANFLGADADNLALIPNATTGVNTVLQSLCFTSEDELLITNHEYNACRNAINFIAQQTSAKLVVAEIPFPLIDETEIIEAIFPKISPQTKLVLIDNVTSQTGLVFPVENIVKKLNELGIDTLIDGAHAPGMLSLNLEKIGATYYTGNCHKWMCAPKGTGFLYVRRDKQKQIHPLVISHGANSPINHRSRFRLEFDWMGTNDVSGYLSIPEAINFMGSLLPGGWDELREKNRNLTLKARKTICEALNIPLPTPDNIIACLASIPLPQHLTTIPPTSSSYLDPLQDLLKNKFAIEVPIIPWLNGQKLLRISGQIYNSLEQYEYLADCLIKGI